MNKKEFLGLLQPSNFFSEAKITDTKTKNQYRNMVIPTFLAVFNNSRLAQEDHFSPPISLPKNFVQKISTRLKRSQTSPKKQLKLLKQAQKYCNYLADKEIIEPIQIPLLKTEPDLALPTSTLELSPKDFDSFVEIFLKYLDPRSESSSQSEKMIEFGRRAVLGVILFGLFAPDNVLAFLYNTQYKDINFKLKCLKFLPWHEYVKEQILLRKKKPYKNKRVKLRLFLPNIALCLIASYFRQLTKFLGRPLKEEDYVFRCILSGPFSPLQKDEGYIPRLILPGLSSPSQYNIKPITHWLFQTFHVTLKELLNLVTLKLPDVYISFTISYVRGKLLVSSLSDQDFFDMFLLEDSPLRKKDLWGFSSSPSPQHPSPETQSPSLPKSSSLSSPPFIHGSVKASPPPQKLETLTRKKDSAIIKQLNDWYTAKKTGSPMQREDVLANLLAIQQNYQQILNSSPLNHFPMAQNSEILDRYTIWLVNNRKDPLYPKKLRKKDKLEPSTISEHLSVVSFFVYNFLRDIPLKLLATPEEAGNAVARGLYLLGLDEMASGQRKKVISILKEFFWFAEKEFKVPQPDWEHHPELKDLKYLLSLKESKIMTPVEFVQFRSFCKNKKAEANKNNKTEQWWKWSICEVTAILLYFLGLRISEAGSLLISLCRFSTREPYLALKEFKQLGITMKTTAGYRTIPLWLFLPEEYFKILIQWYERVCRISRYFICDINGNSLADKLESILQRALNEAGLGYLKPHDLRRSFSSWNLLRWFWINFPEACPSHYENIFKDYPHNEYFRTVDHLQELAEVLGHKDARPTTRTYLPIVDLLQLLQLQHFENSHPDWTSLSWDTVANLWGENISRQAIYNKFEVSDGRINTEVLLHKLIKPPRKKKVS